MTSSETKWIGIITHVKGSWSIGKYFASPESTSALVLPLSIGKWTEVGWIAEFDNNLEDMHVWEYTLYPGRVIWFKSRNGLTCIGAPLTCIVTLHTSFFVSLWGKSFTLLQHLILGSFSFETALSNNKTSETGVRELLTLSLVILVSPKTWRGDPCVIVLRTYLPHVLQFRWLAVAVIQDLEEISGQFCCRAHFTRTMLGVAQEMLPSIPPLECSGIASETICTGSQVQSAECLPDFHQNGDIGIVFTRAGLQFEPRAQPLHNLIEFHSEPVELSQSSCNQSTIRVFAKSGFSWEPRSTHLINFPRGTTF